MCRIWPISNCLWCQERWKSHWSAERLDLAYPGVMRTNPNYANSRLFVIFALPNNLRSRFTVGNNGHYFNCIILVVSSSNRFWQLIKACKTYFAMFTLLCLGQSNLEFNIRKQEFIEYVRNNNRLEAVRWVSFIFTSHFSLIVSPFLSTKYSVSVHLL